MKPTVTFLLTFLSATTVFAQTYTWTGSTSSDWGTSTNWSPNGVPAATHNIVIYSATNNCQLDANKTVKTLTIESGTLDLNGFKLTVTNGATLKAGNLNGGASSELNCTAGPLQIGTASTTMAINAKVKATVSTFTSIKSTYDQALEVSTSQSSATNSYDNTFNGTVKLTQTGSNALNFGVGQKDIFNGQLQLINTGTGKIVLANSSTGNQINGDIQIQSTNSDINSGITLGGSSSSGITLASGKTISVLTSFTGGTLRFEKFTQAGSTAQSLTLTGTARIQNVSSTWNGSLTLEAPQLISTNSTYNGSTELKKTGSTANSNGGNTFNKPAIIHSAGTGDFIFGVTNPDIFNDDATLRSSGDSEFKVANSALNNKFEKAVILEAYGSSKLLSIGESGGTTLMGTNSYFANGPNDINTGYIYLYKITKSGTLASNIVFKNNALLGIRNCTLYGDLDIKTPWFGLAGNQFYGKVKIEKTAASSLFFPSGSEECTFHSDLTIINNAALDPMKVGSDYYKIVLGYKLSTTTGTDTYKGKCYFTNSCEGNIIYLAYNSPNNTFEDDITFESTNRSGGIFFCEDGGTAKQTGGTIKIGPLGFVDGNLRFEKFTKLSTDNVTIASSGTPQLNSINSTWYGGLSINWNRLNTFDNSKFYGNVTLVSPRLDELKNCEFFEEFSIQKTGRLDNTWYGGNEFHKKATIEVDHNNSSSEGNGITMGNDLADTYYGDVHYIRKRRAGLRPSYSSLNYYYGNVTFETGNTNPVIPIVVGQNGGGAVFASSTDQTLSQIGGPTTVHKINILGMEKPSGKLIVDMNLEVIDELMLEGGILKVNQPSKPLTMLNGSSVSGGYDDSYVEGKIKKIGNSAFTFPTGGGGFIIPISISSPSSATDEFTAEYVNKDPQSDGYLRSNRQTGLERVSRCEYWNLDRGVSTSSSVFVTLNYRNRMDGSTCGGVDDINSLVVARWNGSQWVNHGGDNQVGNSVEGSVESASAVSSFSPFTLGTDDALNNPLPIKLLEWRVKQVSLQGITLSWKTEQMPNISHFEIEKRNQSTAFESIGYINADTENNMYQFTDPNPEVGPNYYRLKAVEKNGSFEYSPVIAAEFGAGAELTVKTYPNPANHFLNIIASGKQPIDIVICNTLSEVIYKNRFVSNISIDVSQWTQGLYLVKCFSQSGFSQTDKILIKR